MSIAMGSRPPTVNSIGRSLCKARQSVLVVAGAGMSVASGIPDFRSESGLYPMLKQVYGISYPESVFDLDYFRRDPRAFFAVASEVLPRDVRPSLSHFFLRLLHEKGLLRRVYTQNIDTLERIAGVPAEMLVEAHGSFASATCTGCKQTFDSDFVRDAMKLGYRAPGFGKSAHGPDSLAGTKFDAASRWNSKVGAARVPLCPSCGSVVKPDITFFGEAMPSRFFDLIEEDCKAASLLIVIGTSLRVYPVADVPLRVPPDTPRLLLNKDLVLRQKHTVAALRAMAPDELHHELAHQREVDPDSDDSDSEEDGEEEVESRSAPMAGLASDTTASDGRSSKAPAATTGLPNRHGQGPSVGVSSRVEALRGAEAGAGAGAADPAVDRSPGTAMAAKGHGTASQGDGPSGPLAAAGGNPLQGLSSPGELPAFDELSPRDKLQLIGHQGGFLVGHPDNKRDAFYQGQCDEGVAALCEAAGWMYDLVDTVRAWSRRRSRSAAASGEMAVPAPPGLGSSKPDGGGGGDSCKPTRATEVFRSIPKQLRSIEHTLPKPSFQVLLRSFARSREAAELVDLPAIAPGASAVGNDSRLGAGSSDPASAYHDVAESAGRAATNTARPSQHASAAQGGLGTIRELLERGAAAPPSAKAAVAIRLQGVGLDILAQAERDLEGWYLILGMQWALRSKLKAVASRVVCEGPTSITVQQQGT